MKSSASAGPYSIFLNSVNVEGVGSITNILNSKKPIQTTINGCHFTPVYDLKIKTVISLTNVIVQKCILNFWSNKHDY